MCLHHCEGQTGLPQRRKSLLVSAAAVAAVAAAAAGCPPGRGFITVMARMASGTSVNATAFAQCR
jgi:hypothetical protein